MQEKEELNLIRIGIGTRVNGVLRFVNVLLKERNFREIHFRALGASIGKLVSIVELLKLTHPGMHQVNTIGTVSFQLKEGQDKITNERLYPKLEIVLSLDEPKDNNKGEGFQDKILEEERIKLCKIAERNDERFASGVSGSFRGIREIGIRGGFRERGFRGRDFGERDFGGRGFRERGFRERGFRGRGFRERGYRGRAQYQ